MKRWKALRRMVAVVLMASTVTVVAWSNLRAQSADKAKAPSAMSQDEQIDVAMNAFTDYDLLRLRARPPVKRGADIKPPFKQQPPDAQKDFCPQC